MKKFHQFQWQGIAFSSFIDMDFENIADSEFYERFYQAFYGKYSDWTQLDDDYAEQKTYAAKSILEQFDTHGVDKNQAILSIGCGLGYIEKVIYENGYKNLNVCDVSQKALQWIESILQTEYVFPGFFPDCIPEGKKYDVIMMNVVDYALEDKIFISLLQNAKKYVKENGMVLITSPTYYRVNFFEELKEKTIKGIITLLDTLGIRKRKHPGQLWGYMRTEEEFYNLFQKSTFTEIEIGYFKDKSNIFIIGKP